MKRYSPKHEIFAQGDNADAVYFLEEGKVKLTVVSTEGKEAVVAILEREHFFGEQSHGPNSSHGQGFRERTRPPHYSGQDDSDSSG